MDSKKKAKEDQKQKNLKRREEKESLGPQLNQSLENELIKQGLSKEDL